MRLAWRLDCRTTRANSADKKQAKPEYGRDYGAFGVNASLTIILFFITITGVPRPGDTRIRPLRRLRGWHQLSSDLSGILSPITQRE